MLFPMRFNTPFRMFPLLTVQGGFVHVDMRFNFENCYKENDEFPERMQHEEDPVYLPRQYINEIFKVLDIPYFFVVGRYCLLSTYYFFIIYASARYNK